MFDLNSFQPSLGSDNHSGVHPDILNALVNSNVSHCSSYGTDDLSQKCFKKFESLFGNRAKSFFVFNGTAANVLSLKALCPSWQSVICTDVSHLNLDECGAPEAIAGIKLVTAPSQNGKLDPSRLENLMIRNGDQHHSQIGAISITQPTELGTVYSEDELLEIKKFAVAHDLKIHVDGARLANAMSYLDVSFHNFVEILKPSAISFGGTKNGLLGCEAVILFEPEIAKTFKFIRKQNMQLPSKSRFMAAQFLAYLNDDLYLKIARESHQKAVELSSALKDVSEIQQLYPIQSNAVFISFPKAWTKPLRNSLFFYIWDEIHWSARLMTSFDTTHEHISQFVETAKKLSNHKGTTI